MYYLQYNNHYVLMGSRINLQSHTPHHASIHPLNYLRSKAMQLVWDRGLVDAQHEVSNTPLVDDVMQVMFSTDDPSSPGFWWGEIGCCPDCWLCWKCGVTLVIVKKLALAANQQFKVVSNQWYLWPYVGMLTWFHEGKTLGGSAEEEFTFGKERW